MIKCCTRNLNLLSRSRRSTKVPPATRAENFNEAVLGQNATSGEAPPKVGEKMRNRWLFSMLGIFISIFIGNMTGQCQEPVKYTEVKQQDLFASADLILDGSLIAVNHFEGGDINALDEGNPSKYKNIGDMTHDLDIRWLVTLEVDKVIKGKFPGKEFKIAVHSPVMSFKFSIGDSEKGIPPKGYGNKYRIYAKRSSLGGMLVVGKEML